MRCVFKAVCRFYPRVVCVWCVCFYVCLCVFVCVCVWGGRLPCLCVCVCVRVFKWVVCVGV